MKVKVLFAALASLVLASCTNNEQLLDESKKGREIRFAVASGIEQTRAEHDPSQTETFSGALKIWAWYSGTNTPVIVDDAGQSGDVYENGVFTSGHTYYWPDDESNIDFLAIPMSAINNNYFVEPERTADGKTTYTFNVGHGGTHTAAHHNVDLMASEILTQNSGTVPIILRHLTSRLNITVSQQNKQSTTARWAVTVEELTIKNIFNDAHVALDQDWTAVNLDPNGNSVDRMWDQVETGKCDWNIISSDWTLADILSSDDDTAAKTFSTSAPHYVVPQDLVTSGQQLYIKYKIETKYLTSAQPNVVETFEKTIDLYDLSGIKYWAMNKNIQYNVFINPVQQSNEIFFQVQVEAWGNVTGSTTITPGSSN